MEVGIFGDFNSLSTGYNILPRLWSLMTSTQGFELFHGWEVQMAKKYPNCNFTVTTGQTNQEIINKLSTDIAYKPKDLYIVQTGTWYNFSTGILDYKEEEYQVLPNLTYNLLNPRSYLQSKWVMANLPHLPNSVIKEKPSYRGAVQDMNILPTIYHAYIEDPTMDCRSMETIEFQLKDKLGMEYTYTDSLNVQVKDNLGSQLKQEENFGLICNLKLLSQHHNIWYFHWEPPIGRPEDFFELEHPHTGTPHLNKDRKQNRLTNLGFYTAKLEKLDTSKRIHPFSVMDYLIMSHRDKIDNENNFDDKGYLSEELHAIIFGEYINSNDTLMEILANG